MYHKIIEKLKNKNLAILGFGVEGKSTYSFIRKYLKEESITILDKKEIVDNVVLGDPYTYILTGENYLSNLEGFDFIFKSPGISLRGYTLSSIQDKITSQIELVLEVGHKQVIGITGTKGKSTTSSLLYKVLKDQDKDVYLLGNIGLPVFDCIEQFTPDAILVIEMSSHQLDFLKVSPHIGMILNLFEEHLDYAGTKDAYYAMKMHMFDYQCKEDISIYNLDNVDLKNKVMGHYFSQLYKVTTLETEVDDHTIFLKDDAIIFRNKILAKTDCMGNLVGKHNLQNILFVLLVSELLHLNLDRTLFSIQTFIPLKHRLEFVGVYQDVIYYSDTIATIPNATIQGIEALEKVNTLIFGGMDRGIDYQEFIEYLQASSIENLIAMPTTGYGIVKKIHNKNVYCVETLKEAVLLAKKVTKKNQICLLSPAASSYEYFKDYREKGDYYIQLIQDE